MRIKGKKRYYTQRGKDKRDHRDPYKVLPKKIVKRKKLEMTQLYQRTCIEIAKRARSYK